MGKVTLHRTTDEGNQGNRHINLFGYGGNAVVAIRGIEKGPVGSCFLKMGDTKDLTCTGYLERQFIIYNRGPLEGVAVIQLKLGQNELFDSANVFVTPDKCTIPPEKAIKITVTCKPKRNQLKKLLKQKTDVLTMATLTVITGSEPDRLRLCTLLKRVNISQGPYSSLNFLIFDAPEVINSPDDFVAYQESTVRNGVFVANVSFIKCVPSLPLYREALPIYLVHSAPKTLHSQ